MKRTSTLVICLLATLQFSQQAGVTAPFDYGTVEYEQPGGTITFNAHNSGDEFIWWFETDDGYEIVKGVDGWFYYATLDSSGEYTASTLKVGIDDPVENNIPLYLQRSTARLAAIEQMIQDFEDELLWGEEPEPVIPKDGTNRPSRIDEVTEVTLKVLLVEFQDVDHEAVSTRENIQNRFFQLNYNSALQTCPK